MVNKIIEFVNVLYVFKETKDTFLIGNLLDIDVLRECISCRYSDERNQINSNTQYCTSFPHWPFQIYQKTAHFEVKNISIANFFANLTKCNFKVYSLKIKQSLLFVLIQI